MNMCIANTLFDKPVEQKMTYKLLGGWDQAGHWIEGEKTQIDVITVNENFRTSVLTTGSDTT